MTEVTVPKSAFRDLASEILVNGGSFRFKARGSSMSPFIRDGSLITVERIGSESIRTGAVVLYRTGPAVAVHRIAGRTKRYDLPAYVVRSDLFPFADEIVIAEHILGQITEVRWSGRTFHVDRGVLRLAGLLLAQSRTLAYVVTRVHGFLSRIRSHNRRR